LLQAQLNADPHLLLQTWRRRNTFVLVHRKPLLEQWIKRLSEFLAVPPTHIGRVGGGPGEPTGRLGVAMLQSLVRKGEVRPMVADYGFVLLHGGVGSKARRESLAHLAAMTRRRQRALRSIGYEFERAYPEA
jgi:hypothetical protein